MGHKRRKVSEYSDKLIKHNMTLQSVLREQDEATYESLCSSWGTSGGLGKAGELAKSNYI